MKQMFLKLLYMQVLSFYGGDLIFRSPRDKEGNISLSLIEETNYMIAIVTFLLLYWNTMTKATEEERVYFSL